MRVLPYWFRPQPSAAAEKPLRDELLSIERLEERALALAASLTVDPDPRHRAHNIFPRFRDNARVLGAAYRTLADDVRTGEFVVSAADWLLDNFHLVTAEIIDIRRNLPRTYYRTLPTLASREHAGEARIYAVAVELIRHSDSRLDRQQLVQFLNSYQRVAPLTIGELWAWPSMLKLALIENLRRLADELISARTARQAADRYVARADGGVGVEELPAASGTAFIVQLLHRIREYGVRLSPIRVAVDDHLAGRHTTAEDTIREEHQRQGMALASVANAITSLRLCAAIDWQEYVESVSLVEQVLQRDPAGAYRRMDFLSRDRQRQAVETLAPASGEGQIRVALKAIESARQAAASGSTGDRAAHVGYHLVDRGRGDLEADLAYRPGISKRLQRVLLRHPTLFYLGGIALGTSCLVAAAVAYAGQAGGARPLLILVALLVLLPASDLTIALIQRVVVKIVGPQRLPRLDFSKGIPESARTMVIVPTMLTSVAGVDALVEHVEVLALGNLDPAVHVAILSDFADTSTPDAPGDAALLERACAGIQALNLKYGGTEGNRFFLFHRARQWNVQEHAWIGWERKRGKIEEFNRLLRGATDTSFSTQVGDLDVLPSVRYCITLDSDTRLPRDAAHRLIGIIAHPLNEPRFDRKAGRVIEGYAILQPRVSVTMASAAGSLFARTYAGHTGVDPYTTAVSDVYQDLFREGIFTGKGLYDVDAFAAALEGRVPENALLSHDLFEGLYARTALVTDVEVVDDYPSSVLAHARRQHRWVRGDWQILRWLLPFVPSRGGIDPQPAAAHRAMEDSRQPSAEPAPAGDAAAPGARVDHPARSRDPVDRRRACGARLSQPRPSHGNRARPPAGTVQGHVPANRSRRPEDGRGARWAPARVHGERSRRTPARDRDYAGASRRHPPPAAGVGDRGCQRGPERSAATAGLRDGHDRQSTRGPRRVRRRRGDAPGGIAHRHPDPRVVDRGSRDCVCAQPPDAAAAPSADPAGPRLPDRGRPEDLAVLRCVRHRRGSCAPAGQRAGRLGSDGRAPHLPDQYRPGPARGAGRARSGVHRDARTGAPHR